MREGANSTETRGPVRMPEIHESRPHPMEVFFEPAREYRRRRYASWDPAKRTKKRRAIVTMVHNEPVFLPIWLRYYSRFFAPEDIHVLDNDSTDGSTGGAGFVRVPVAHDRVDWTWAVRTVEEYQHELLERYDVVLVTDVDEIVAPDPEWGTLDEYLDRFDEEWVNCLGYELVHLKEIEPPLNLDRPILDQRGYWYVNGAYDKPALATEPMSWTPGFHHRSDGRYHFDPDLRLIHLHRMDYDLCLAKHRLLRERAWSSEDMTEDRGTHNRIADEDAFERWFYEDSSSADVEIVVERIPPSWKGLF